MIYLLTILLLLVTAYPTFAQDFQDNFETGIFDTSTKWNKNGGCYSYSFQVVANPCDAEDEVLQVTNILGDDNSNCTATGWDNLAGGCPSGEVCYPYTHRAEFIPQVGQGVRPDNLEDEWKGWRVFIPEDYPSTNVLSFITEQMIPPPHSGTDWTWRIHSNSKFRYDIRQSLAGVPTDQESADVETIRRGEWYNFVKHYKRSTTSTGRAEFWINGVKVLDYTGQTSQSTNADGLSKWGLYRGTAIPTSLGGAVYRLLYDDIKLNVGPEGNFALVAPTKATGVCDPDGDPPPPPVGGAFPSVGILDSFGTNQTPIAGIWTNGVTGTGSCKASGGILTENTGTDDCYVTSTYNGPQEAYATLPNATSQQELTNMRILACLQGGLGAATADGYAVRFNKQSAGDRVYLERLTDGAFVVINTFAGQELSNENKMGIRVDDTADELFAYVDVGSGWTELFSEPDSTYNCTGTNIGVWFANNTTQQLDAYGGGTTTAPPASDNYGAFLHFFE